MAEFIEVVIKMEKNEYLGIKSFPNNVTSYPVTIHLYDAIKNGTPLPKGHGRLIDADALKHTYDDRLGDDFTAFHFLEDIDYAPTIIAPDKEVTE